MGYAKAIRIFPVQSFLTVPVSAARGEQVEALEQALLAALPDGPNIFPEDQLSDRPESFFAAELLREQLTRRYAAELPYQLSVEIEQFKGSLYNASAAVEYKPWKHVGIGLGVDTLRVKVEADGQDYPGIDFKGKVEFTYFGLQLYAKLFF